MWRAIKWQVPLFLFIGSASYSHDKLCVCTLLGNKKKTFFLFFSPCFFIAVASHLKRIQLNPISSVELYLNCNLQGHSATHQKQDCSLGCADAKHRRKWCYIAPEEDVICLQIVYDGAVLQK